MGQERVDNLFASESWSAVYTAFTNVSLKAYDFDTIREALLIYIRQTFPDKYNDFIASSEFVAVLDLVAYLGHSLSYRLDMNTRENFMDLAERKESILRMAKTLGYNKTRPINSRGFMKISSVMTNQTVYDSNGVSLANRVVNWNDANDSEWYENFITVINSALNKDTKIKNPKATLNISTVEHNLYEINEHPTNKSTVYGFKANVSGKNRTFEAVRAGFGDQIVEEMMPDRTKNFTIINRNDNLGPASDRTGFFVFAKLGKLASTTYTYNIATSNRIQTVATNNISNSDVWIQKIGSDGTILNEVTKVDNSTRETAIYNAIRYGSGDLVSVRTTVDNGIELHFPDGNFGNAAYGTYRVWYRVADNESYSVDTNTVSNATISIPYVGNDGVTYQLTVTLRSTRDFSENYQAETMASVRRIAPRSFYAQDRMVNAQDYNVLPLSLGTNVVKKIKSINTNFSGNSRYFEMDDVTGHHSNVTVNSTDGSLYLDDDVVTMKLRFNRENGNSINFIRNEISKVIKNVSLANLYYINNINDPTVVLNTETAPDVFRVTGIEIDPTDPKTIRLIPTVYNESDADFDPVEFMHPGDFIKIKTDSSEYWTRIYGANRSGGGVSNSKYTITDIIPEEYKEGQSLFQIVEVVKGFRTRFEDTEILEIKSGAVDDTSVSSFKIKYEYNDTEKRWMWKLHDVDLDDPLIKGQHVYVELSYNPGIRTSDAEYTARFYGKKVVFESESDVKFFYNNTSKVVDIETNLAYQDRIKIDYYKVGNIEQNNSYSNSITNKFIIGYSDLYDYSEDGTYANFELQYRKWTGAPDNIDFINNTVAGITQIPDSTKFVLVNQSGIDIPESISGINAAVPRINPKTNNIFKTVIGDSQAYDDLGEYTLPVTGFDISELATVTNKDPVENETAPIDTAEYNLSAVAIEALAETGNVSNANYSLITLSSSDTEFKGNVAGSYFDYATDKEKESINFAFINSSNLPVGQSPDTIIIADPKNLPDGVIIPSVIQTTPNNPIIEFRFNRDNVQVGTELIWKQFAYAELDFISSKELTMSSIVVEDDGVEIDTSHLELISVSVNENETYSYKLIFWTYDPSGLIDVFDIYTVKDGKTDVSKFKVRVETDVSIKRASSFILPEYSSVSGYIYDTYTGEDGYTNYSKVKLTPMDTNKNPYGIISAIDNRSMVLENLHDTASETSSVDRIPDDYNLSTNVFAAVDDSLLPNIPYMYYNTAQNKWFYRADMFTDENGVTYDSGTIREAPNDLLTLNDTDGTYTLSRDFSVVDNNGKYKIFKNGTKFKITDGISYTNNTMPRYNWEHYADRDRRIDPSTSNIVDVYILTEDYTRKVEQWKSNGFAGSIPKAPNNYELKKTMESLKGKEAISDHVSYVPVKFKPLFGSQASQENQAIFKVVKKKGTLYTDSEIKASVSAVVNEYFKLENWDFGDTFYFSELAAYIHTQLPEHLSSVVITPKYSGNQFTKLLSITSEPNEIFMSVTTSSDVKIIENITDAELSGE